MTSAGGVLTAAASESQQAAVAGALRARGVTEGDRVAFVCNNSAALLSAQLGALRAGIVPVPINPALTAGERRLIVDDADPAVVVNGSDQLTALLAGPTVELGEVPRSRPMHYTSGTTGRPKGVWAGLLDDEGARALQRDEAELWAFEAADRLLVCSPLHHSAPLRFATGVLLAGGEVLVLPKFDAGLVRAAMAEFRPTVAFMVPTHLQRLLSDGAALPTASFRLLVHAGAPCPKALKRAALAAFPRGSLWEFYGSTECQFTACAPDEWLARPGTVGRARTHRRLWTDGDATVWCEVPAYARFEYWRDPVRTAAAWRGSSCTAGDLGRLDDAGYLFLEGRREDLIISGGVNVYPVEVEGVLADHPAVKEVAVFGVADDAWGQRVCAAVVGDVDGERLRAWARERLAGYKCPKSVFSLDELPRTATGKLRRTALAEHFAGVNR